MSTSATARAITSGPLPGADGTVSLAGREGYCAYPDFGASSPPIPIQAASYISSNEQPGANWQKSVLGLLVIAHGSPPSGEKGPPPQLPRVYNFELKSGYRAVACCMGRAPVALPRNRLGATQTISTFRSKHFTIDRKVVSRDFDRTARQEVRHAQPQQLAKVNRPYFFTSSNGTHRCDASERRVNA